jgi:hypothetical protein
MYPGSIATCFLDSHSFAAVLIYIRSCFVLRASLDAVGDYRRAMETLNFFNHVASGRGVNE